MDPAHVWQDLDMIIEMSLFKVQVNQTILFFFGCSKKTFFMTLPRWWEQKHIWLLILYRLQQEGKSRVQSIALPILYKLKPNKFGISLLMRFTKLARATFSLNDLFQH